MTWTDLPPRRAAVLWGGDSPERQVSLASGQCVAEALGDAAYEPTLIDPAREPLEAVDWELFDVCFIALHGGAGEDGRVQHQLERIGVPYTGSGPEASRRAMSKSAAKERFQRAWVPTPAFRLLEAAADDAAVARAAAGLGLPLVVKPDALGSSLGVSVVEEAGQLPAALNAARYHGSPVLMERAIRGRELTVSVLNRRALPVLEIVTDEAVFDYQAKYHSPRTEYRFRTGLPPQTLSAVSGVAVAAAAALDTRGLVRVDVMLDERRRPWVLEVNTVPGMTRRSLSPMAAAASGLDMPALCDWMVRDALRLEVCP